MEASFGAIGTEGDQVDYFKDLESRIQKYSSRYEKGKDIWTGNCLTCGVLECSCSTSEVFSIPDEIEGEIENDSEIELTLDDVFRNLLV